MSKNHVKSQPVASPPHLNENGISAKKAESCLAAGPENNYMDIGQSGSVPVGIKEVTAPHFDTEEWQSEAQATEAQDKVKSQKGDDAKVEHASKSAGLDLGVAAGLALLVADEAAKALKDASKNWESKVDAAAIKAHETIESAQRAVKDPVGETLKQMDHLAHPRKDKGNKKKRAS